MPPKPKFTKEELIKVALELTREGGIDSVVARNLGKKLNTAPSTIFTHFDSVEEIRKAVVEASRKLYNAYVRRTSDGTSVKRIWSTVYPFCNGGTEFIFCFVYAKA